MTSEEILCKRREDNIRAFNEKNPPKRIEHGPNLVELRYHDGRKVYFNPDQIVKIITTP